MAVVFVRSLLLPKSESRKYTPLRSTSPVNSMERGNSLESGRNSFGNEKVQSSAYSAKSLLPARINPRIISDATIGLSDGLTVPFALTAGLSALGQTNVVIYGGFAELVAGGISMGLGGYLGAKSEAESYQAALTETKAIVADDRDKAAALIRATFTEYDFSEETLSDMAATLMSSPTQLVDFLMKFHHQLAEADFAPSKAYVSGLTIALGYICGGLIALLPYLFFSSIQQGFYGSIIVMALALLVFGWVKTSLVGENDRWICLKNGIQMMMLGGVAAGAAITSVKAIGS